ncbi:RagB/SusD family nutrient uptake outer membrane protein [Sphingobacterium athyrii]|uniref:Uncharacterized protein n=1 Tax=Sphingobacterium athyrii TaxID=2152717 RepID=A0A363NUT7_9SPHI|nr:RagB/SusD family nutrient uptake outer membrane protein [Sphingobacterium athyrii]PUV24576.1 hypothetical protein DCO56_14640 [Sphingobacterium athyrii]
MKKFFIYMVICACCTLTACQNFLDEKPDIKLVVPRSLNDAELLLNDYSTMNTNYPQYGELGSDDYFLTGDLWESASDIDERNTYIWADLPYEDATQWRGPYKAVNNANQVLEVLAGLNASDDPGRYARLWGEAHFFRAFAFHQLAGTFCSAYQNSTAGSEYGIPLRLTPGIDRQSLRGTLEDTYRQIILGYQAAVSNLPVENPYLGKPALRSAYAGLSRAYLDMGEFEKAYLYADSCLKIYPDLIDFNSLSNSVGLPFARFNKEVLFPAVSKSTGLMNADRSYVDSVLYKLYEADDLRKTLFFEASSELRDAYHFKGSFDNSSNNLFVGLSTSEIYLVKAESAARLRKIDVALSTMNSLLKSRWKTGRFVNWTERDPDKLLTMIILERRKELVYRGRRWSDLKRLNLDPRFAVVLTRKLGDQFYTLDPNSTKYAYRLSEMVVTLGEIPQNKR